VLGAPDLVIGRIRQQRSVRKYPIVSAKAHVVTNRAIHPKKRPTSDLAVTRDDNMRTDKYIILNRGVVADVVPRPKNHPVPDCCEGLNRIVLEDEAMVA